AGLRRSPGRSLDGRPAAGGRVPHGRITVSLPSVAPDPVRPDLRTDRPTGPFRAGPEPVGSARPDRLDGSPSRQSGGWSRSVPVRAPEPDCGARSRESPDRLRMAGRVGRPGPPGGGDRMNPRLSVVIPVYNSADCLAELVARLGAELRPLGTPFEVI